MKRSVYVRTVKHEGKEYVIFAFESPKTRAEQKALADIEKVILETLSKKGKK